MSAPGLDTDEHLAALVALLATPTRSAFPRGEVPGLGGNPGDEPARYLILDLDRRYAETKRLVALASRSGWRLGVVAVGKQRTEVTAGLRHASRVLDGAHITVAGETSTPFQHESTTAPESDDGYFSANVTHTYAL